MKTTCNLDIVSKIEVQPRKLLDYEYRKEKKFIKLIIQSEGYYIGGTFCYTEKSIKLEDDLIIIDNKVYRKDRVILHFNGSHHTHVRYFNDINSANVWANCMERIYI